MRKKIIAIVICMLLCCCMLFLELNICRLAYEKNKAQSQEVLKLAHELVDNEASLEGVQNTEENNINAGNTIEKTENDLLGILYIEKLQVEAPVKEGTTQEVMKTSVGHFIESDLWDGNVSLASHNSGTSMHYFQDIDKLQVNDEIQYKTQLGEKKYKVQSVEKIKDTDWSKIVGNTGSKDNTITLITCINGQPDYRLCVRGIEI